MLTLVLLFPPPQAADAKSRSLPTDVFAHRSSGCQLLPDARLHDLQRLSLHCRSSRCWHGLLPLQLEKSGSRRHHGALPLARLQVAPGPEVLLNTISQC